MPREVSELNAELTRLASTISKPSGTVLFRCGDPVSGVFLIRKGAVRIALDTPNGVYPPRTLGPGEIAGLPATLTGIYSLSAEVVEDAELGFVPGERVTELLECSPRLCLAAMRIISQEISRTRAALKETPALNWLD